MDANALTSIIRDQARFRGEFRTIIFKKCKPEDPRTYQNVNPYLDPQKITEPQHYMLFRQDLTTPDDRLPYPDHSDRLSYPDNVDCRPDPDEGGGQPAPGVAAHPA